MCGFKDWLFDIGKLFFENVKYVWIFCILLWNGGFLFYKENDIFIFLFFYLMVEFFNWFWNICMVFDVKCFFNFGVGRNSMMFLCFLMGVGLSICVFDL